MLRLHIFILFPLSVQSSLLIWPSLFLFSFVPFPFRHRLNRDHRKLHSTTLANHITDTVLADLLQLLRIGKAVPSRRPFHTSLPGMNTIHTVIMTSYCAQINSGSQPAILFHHHVRVPHRSSEREAQAIHTPKTPRTQTVVPIRHHIHPLLREQFCKLPRQ